MHSHRHPKHQTTQFHCTLRTCPSTSTQSFQNNIDIYISLYTMSQVFLTTHNVINYSLIQFPLPVLHPSLHYNDVSLPRGVVRHDCRPCSFIGSLGDHSLQRKATCCLLPACSPPTEHWRQYRRSHAILHGNHAAASSQPWTI